MSYKYRIYCTEPSDIGWQEIWSDVPPTTCPNNASHSVNSSSVQKIGEEKEVLRMSNLNKKIKISQFTKILSTYYDTKKFGKLRRVKLVSYKDNSVTSYDMEVLNLSDANILISNNHTNNDSNLEDIGLITSFPNYEVFLEINCKKNGGNITNKIYINEVIFYSE